MALKGRKITEAGIGQYGVISAPDRLTGTIPENKRVFDNLVRAVVAEKINGLVDDLSSEAAGASGISQLGMTPIEGMDAENAQAALEELKSQLEQAIIGKAGVASFKGRKGAVVPASGDYTAQMVGAEPAFTVLPVSKGGTGTSSESSTRTILGIGTRISVASGETKEIVLTNSGAFLISAISNAHDGLLAVTTKNTNIQSVEEIIPLRNWSYSFSTSSLALSVTPTNQYGMYVAVTTLQTPANIPFTGV